MEKPVKGEVVVLPFPFSDLSSAKKRPALVLAELDGDDLILCQITSKARKDRYVVSLENNDFKRESLNLNSFVRPNRLFTADRSLISYRAGLLKEVKVDEIIDAVCDILRK